jgi:hypothetical protein
MILALAPRPGPSIKSISERHHEIKRRLVAGERQVDIAHSLGMSQSWLSIVISSPAFQIVMEEERKLADINAADVSKRLTRLAPDAMTVLENAIRKKREETLITPMQQVLVARDALDRAGHGRPIAQQAAPTSIKINIVQFSAPSEQKPQVVIEGEKS